MKGGTLMQEKTAEIYSIFSPVEGLNTVYYGKVRNGKTYNATADIIELLERVKLFFQICILILKGFMGEAFFFMFSFKTFLVRNNFIKLNIAIFIFLNWKDPLLYSLFNR